MNPPTPKSAVRHIYQVSELNQKVKQLLEDKYPFLWISGEISNFRIPSSGHCYFTLKDPRSQIAAVLFRNQAASLAFTPKEGMAVVGFGRISVYEPRGTYQIILEYLEPKGVGNLQIAFEELKRKLADEGLFDESHKIPLPAFPKKVAIVTSPTGAAVWDFIKIAQRRLPNVQLLVVPARVQGQQAPREVIQAIHLLNEQSTCDIIVLARGGGSIEDLWAFNDEKVARTIFASRIPVVSAVGHETDFTIADFVSDLRAPTPSAAAEMILPSKMELVYQVARLNKQLYLSTVSTLKLIQKQLHGLSERVVHPRRKLEDWRMRLDDLTMRSNATIREILVRKRERHAYRRDMLMLASPGSRIKGLRTGLATGRQTLNNCIKHQLHYRRASLESNTSTLAALNPMAILERGYSITRTLPGRAIVRSARSVKLGQPLEVVLGSGKLTVTVDKKTAD